MIDKLIGWAVRNRGAVPFGILALIGAGVWAMRTLRVDAFPDLTDVQVQILVEAPGLSPVEVERLATAPIEVAMGGLPRVTQVRSVSKYAFAAVTIVFEEDVDLYFARTLVAERLQGVRESLPADAEAEMGPMSAANSEIYFYTLEGNDQDLMALRTLHDRVVKPQLRTVPGVAEVNSFGGYVRQVQVVIRPEALASYRLTLHDVVAAIEANNAVAAGGYLEHRDEQYILRGLGQASGPEDLARTVIRSSEAGVPVLVGDVAEVGYGSELRQGAVSRDGRGEVVSGMVLMLRGENGRDVVSRVRQRVEAVNRSLPDGVRVRPYYDQTDLVDGTLHTVRRNLLEGGFLVIAVLLLFLGNVRAALIVALTIPFSLLFAFVGMRWLGLSANLMSLGAIDFGMIVDGAVVMAEHYVKTLHGDEERGEFPRGPALAARLAEAGREVARPIAFGVLIIMLVYVPIATLQGLEGRMFRPMAITVAIALFGSLVLALVWVPAAATLAFRHGARESRYAVRLAAWLDRRYAPLLARVMRRPGSTLASAAALFAGSLLLVPLLGTEFLPELDEGSIVVQALRDPGVSLTRSVEMQREMERTLRMSPEVSTVVSRVGRAEIGSDPMGLHQADVFVMLKPRSRWRAGLDKDALQEEMEHRLGERVPGMGFVFTQPMAMRLDELISGVRGDLAVKVFGDDPEQNRRAAERIASVIRAVPGAAEVQVEATDGQGYLNVRMDRAAMARFGIPMREMQEALETAVGGRPVSQVVDGAYALDVVVQYPAELRTSVEAIGAITVPSPGGARIALAQVADIRLESGPVQVSREQAQRLVVVSANVSGRDLGGFADDVQAAVARADLPAGVFVDFGGQFQNQRRAMARLRVVVPLSIALIALLLYVSLRSWTLAGLVLANLPFAAVGGIAALWLRGLHLSVSASIGFIALFGVAVLNGLVLLSTIQRRRREGHTAADAATAGSRERLRPVLMTATVASIGFIPVALSHGTGAEVQRPLATVVIGGLVTSTLLTLLVLPALYAWIEGRRERRAPGAEAAG
ncbi:efflux RND transporter permease subunit [Longimicrobium terrae]|uniref:Cobalt-zinc-cadmium resistance protein CzcA n=1 Tax=Longimicrobium terrae TaxID=1639882 RepID=A0A841H1N1_9BACT|nr:CusA/CzcA family heavy metal efflux RND transporter [Longimicrobium terrae]MBB4637530.1 cobalt-zinc-cadmium resistance protein CzcA [Longimicrobium terrae]MBB6071927.1 cobalt-zinc-cadmium resistance protein CzcA [Longimicrobium terrae]NNC30474.1 efflux RND transporter permease subunit [Longimicrobium terrae]